MVLAGPTQCRDCLLEGKTLFIGASGQPTAYAYGDHWKCQKHRDRYEPTEKRLDWGHHIHCAKLYFLSPNYDGIIPTERSWFTQMIHKLWEQLLNYKKSLTGWFKR